MPLCSPSKRKQRFAQVHALQQALLADPKTRAAAKAMAHLCPKKTFSWSYFMPSDTSEATINTRAQAIPAYLTAVLNHSKMGEHAAVHAFLGMGEGVPAF